MDVLAQAGLAVEFLRGQTPGGWRPEAALTLGTGLSGLAEEIEPLAVVPYEEIPGFPLSTVESHAGQLILGTLAGRRVAALAGRFHLYEGYSAQEVVFPVRVLALLGAETFIFSNAAGGLDLNMQPGRVMLIGDHINLTGHNPLRGANVEAWGERFPDMSRTYDAGLLDLARRAAYAEGLAVHEGVYVSVMGPSLETPAETRMLRGLGADAVGMSTVMEVIAARHMGRRVAALSAIANVNDPDDMEAIALEAIIENAARAGADLARLMKGVLAGL
jgi:purine-nucleoside phosphorylase